MSEEFDGLNRKLAKEMERRTWLANLVAEAIQYEYLDRVACPPTWIAEAQLATTSNPLYDTRTTIGTIAE